MGVVIGDGWALHCYHCDARLSENLSDDEVSICPRCWAAIQKQIADLEKELAGLRAWKRGVDEALNSGDGAYRP